MSARLSFKKHVFSSVLAIFFLTFSSEGSARGADTPLKSPPTVVDPASHLTVSVGIGSNKPWKPDASGLAVLSFNAAVHGQPLYVGKEFELDPGLLSAWSWDFKNKWYELTVSRSAKFQNGRKVTAKDVEFFLLKNFFSEKETLGRGTLGNIEGVDSIKRGSPFQSGSVSGVNVVDADTLTVKLKYPNPGFLFTLARAAPTLVPPEEVGPDLFTFKNVPVGAGAYKVAWSDPKNYRVRLQLMDEKLSSAPKTIDLIDEDNPQLSDVMRAVTDENPNPSKFVKVTQPLPIGVFTLSFNRTSPLGNNPVFREAVSLALKRSELSRPEWGTEAATQILPKHFWGRSDVPEKYDLKKAIELVKSLPAEMRNKEHKVYILSGRRLKGALETLKDQLALAGIKIRYEEMIKNSTFTEKDADVPLKVGSILTDYLDPINMFARHRQQGGKPRERPENDAEYEKLFQEAEKASSLELRAEALKNLSHYFLKENYAVPLFYFQSSFWINKNKIESFGLQNGGLTLFFDRFKMIQKPSAVGK